MDRGFRRSPAQWSLVHCERLRQLPNAAEGWIFCANGAFLCKEEQCEHPEKMGPWWLFRVYIGHYATHLCWGDDNKPF